MLTKAPTYGLDALGFKVEAAEDLDALAARIEAAGVRLTRHARASSAGPGTTLRFRAPSGHVVELVHGMAQVGNGMPSLNPPIGPDGLVGMHPPRIDHIFLMRGRQRLHRLLPRRARLPVDEQILADDGYQLASFLERSHSTHDIAFLTGPDGGFHHVAFWVDDWNELRHAADTCAYHGITVDAGRPAMARHGDAASTSTPPATATSSTPAATGSTPTTSPPHHRVGDRARSSTTRASSTPFMTTHS